MQVQISVFFVIVQNLTTDFCYLVFRGAGFLMDFSHKVTESQSHRVTKKLAN